MKKLGLHQLGTNMIRLAVRDGTGAEFGPSPAESGIYLMRIGLDYDQWQRVYSNLLHEAFEFSLAQLGLRFQPDTNYAQCADEYRFNFNHHQFSEATARAAWFVDSCVSELEKAWKAQRNKWSRRSK